MYFGLREACRAGYTDITAHILETERADDEDGSRGYLECCRTPLEMACGAGDEGAVRLLLAAGADPVGRGMPRKDDVNVPDHDVIGHHIFSTGSMFAAAVGGYIGFADILVAEGGLELGEADWHLVARGAIECGQAAFSEWMLAQNVFGSADEGWAGEQFDLLGEACVWGNTEILRTLNAHGFLLSRPVWALDLRAPPPSSLGPESDSNYGSVPLPPPLSYPNDRDRSLARFGSQPLCLRFDSLLLAAMSWSRADVVEFLLGLGWEPVEDVLTTSVGSLWKEGWFPRRAVRQMVESGLWAWETCDVPPS